MKSIPCATSRRAGAGIRLIWRLALVWAMGLLFACRSAPPVTGVDAPPTATTPPPSPREELLSALPSLSGLPVGRRGLDALLDEAALLLSLEPPSPAELAGKDAAESARARAKIEADFATGLRWQDNLRLRAVELIGALMEALAGGADPVLTQAVGALVLEDLAALGFDPTGSYRSPSFDISPDQLAVAMAKPDVVYSGLSAELYARCQRAAEAEGVAPWARFCEQSRHGMLVFAQALPACTHPSISRGSARASLAFSGRTVTHERAGLLLQGAFRVPLLDVELDALVAAAHAQLSKRSELPWVPPAAAVAPTPETAPACAHPRRPSQVLVERFPNTLWHSMYLHCEASDCGIEVCADDVGCQRADLQGSPTRLASWIAALARLRPSQDSVLIESTNGESTQRPRVALEQTQLFGEYRDRGAALETIAGLADDLLQCQVSHRYRGRWVLALDAAGKVSGLRAEDDRYLLPMDQALAAESSQHRCIAERFRSLQFERQPGRGKGAPRRITLEVRVPAQLQIDVPFVVRHDDQVGQLLGPERLGRDGFAVALARCAARVQPRVDSLGMCLVLSPGGQIDQLALDPDPAGHARALQRLRNPMEGTGLADPEMSRCVAQALSSFEWTCRDRQTGAGHLALTVDLPSGLVARFDP